MTTQILAHQVRKHVLDAAFDCRLVFMADGGVIDASMAFQVLKEWQREAQSLHRHSLIACGVLPLVHQA